MAAARKPLDGQHVTVDRVQVPMPMVLSFVVGVAAIVVSVLIMWSEVREQGGRHYTQLQTHTERLSSIDNSLEKLSKSNNGHTTQIRALELLVDMSKTRHDELRAEVRALREVVETLRK